MLTRWWRVVLGWWRVQRRRCPGCASDRRVWHDCTVCFGRPLDGPLCLCEKPIDPCAAWVRFLRQMGYGGRG